MKHILKTIAFALFLTVVTGCGSSQTTASDNSQTISNDREARQDARQQERQQLLADLNLRDDQKTEVEAIIIESQERIQTLRNGSGDRRSKMQEMRDISQETDSKLRTILDEEQYETYTAFKEKQREKMRSQMQNRGGRRGF